MLSVLVLVLALSTLIHGSGSPRADLITPQRFGNYSDKILEDARLDVPDLIHKYGYPVEIHYVTSDRYILEIHRIPHGKKKHNVPSPRPIVFLMHGLHGSSADWIGLGPDKGLGYLLAEDGYDVWMANARGNHYSRRHQNETYKSIKFWDFSWHEIGALDLPAMLDFVLEHTNHSGLHYIGHSQGTTVFFVMASLLPEYNNKIFSVQALAPVAYVGNQENELLSRLAPYAISLKMLSSWIGIGEMLPNPDLIAWIRMEACRTLFKLNPLCKNIFFLLGGDKQDDQLNTTRIPIIVGHAPAGASVKQVAHYAQGITSRRFRQYDYGSAGNLKLYGQFDPPDYDLGKVTAPVCLHYSAGDNRANVKDVEKLHQELPNPVGMFKVPLSTFSHIDFTWGMDVKELLYNKVIALMKTFE